ncbi:MAG: hypothetical protein HC908_13640 [Calothrix sp. SM1_7_51]|nr:hypothetical protein [Calothrix sp. SM1_7_51]
MTTIRYINMTLTALRKFVLPPVITSAVVFAAVTAPVFVLGSKQINIELDREPWVNGTIREVALPYVAVATAMTLGAGISVAAIGGWRNSAKKSAQIEQELSSLEKHLQEKDSLLKELKLSEARLQLTGLKSFLDEEVPFEPISNQPVFAATVSQPVVAQTPVPVYQLPAAKPHSSDVARPNTTANTSTQKNSATNTWAFSSAQAFLSYPQANSSQDNLPIARQNSEPEVKAGDFDQLQKQLREMMLKMQTMQD